MVSCPACGAKVFLPGDLAPMSTSPCSKCGHELMMPFQLRQFELRNPIASGGMGTVYKAFDTTLERIVAVKLMRPELVADPASLDNFYREARAAAGLNHTNIIHIYTFDEHEGMRYLVMELADAGSLDGLIETYHKVQELKVLDVGIKIASALDTALKHNLLHRDLKPGNILFNSEGEPKLVDFGLAKKAEGAPDDDGTVWGTPYYIAPEKVKREREDFLSDMYSLAGTLYHALTGHVPFEAPTIEEVVAAQIHTPLTPPNAVVPEISAATSDAIGKAMAKRPEDRFRSYDEFIMGLTAARSQLLISQLQASQEPEATGVLGSVTAPKSWWRR